MAKDPGEFVNKNHAGNPVASPTITGLDLIAWQGELDALRSALRRINVISAVGCVRDDPMESSRGKS